MGPSDANDTVAIVQRCLKHHALAGKLDVPFNLASLIVELSPRRSGANPAAALGLLEAVLTRAALEENTCVGPDDVYHFVSGHRDG